MDRHCPLRQAVATRITKLAAERGRLVTDQAAAQRAAAMPRCGGRYAELTEAGLSPAQIELVSPSTASPAAAALAHVDLVGAIDSELNGLRDFAGRPTFNASSRAGLAEFDRLLPQRNGEKATA